MKAKKKSFNVSSLSGSERNMTTNNVSITITDRSGKKQELNLSPEAQTQLMKVLLTRSPIDQDKPLTEQIPDQAIRVQGIRRFVLPNNNPCLELYLAQGMSIYITFPKEGISAFLEALSTFEEFTAWKNQKFH